MYGYDASYFLALTAIIAAILGAVIVVCTVWAWRLPLHGHCPRCGYDLTHTDSLTCSECGRTPGRLRRALVGRHSWRWLVLGAAMIVAGGSVLYVQRAGWRDLLPTRALLAIAPFIESACDARDWRGEVMRELAQRVREGDLSDRQIARLLNLAARALEDGRSTAQDEYYLSLVAVTAYEGTLWRLRRTEEFVAWTSGEFEWFSAPSRWPLERPIPLQLGARHDWGFNGYWAPIDATVRFGDAPEAVPAEPHVDGYSSVVTTPADLEAGVHELHVEGTILIPTGGLPPNDTMPVGDPITKTAHVELVPFDDIFPPINDPAADAAVRDGLIWEWDRRHQQVRILFPPTARLHLPNTILRLDVMIEGTALYSYDSGIVWNPRHGGLARFYIGQPLADLQVTSLRVLVDRDLMLGHPRWYLDPEPIPYWPGVIVIPVDLDDLPEEGQTRRVPVDE